MTNQGFNTFRTLLALGLGLLLTTACATKSVSTPRDPDQDFSVKLKDSKGNVKTPTAPSASYDGKEQTRVAPSDEETRLQAEAMKSAVAQAVEKAEANHDRVTGVAVSQPPVPVANPAPAPIRAQTGLIPAEQALKWLKNGNRRFVRGSLRNDGISAKDRLRTALQQTPHAVILTASDSRVPPEIIFDQKLGEIFVLRLQDPSPTELTEAGFNEGVGTLGANLVIILGVDGMPAWGNPRGLSQVLTESSEILRRGVASGSVKIVSALYNMESGLVTWAE